MSFDKVAYQREYMRKRRSGGPTILQALESELEDSKAEIAKLQRLLDTNNIYNNGLVKTATQMKDGRILVRLPPEYANKKIRITTIND